MKSLSVVKQNTAKVVVEVRFAGAPPLFVTPCADGVSVREKGRPHSTTLTWDALRSLASGKCSTLIMTKKGSTC